MGALHRDLFFTFFYHVKNSHGNEHVLGYSYISMDHKLAKEKSLKLSQRGDFINSIFTDVASLSLHVFLNLNKDKVYKSDLFYWKKYSNLHRLYSELVLS